MGGYWAYWFVLGAKASPGVPIHSEREWPAVRLSAASFILHAFCILWFPPALDHINPVAASAVEWCFQTANPPCLLP